MTDTFKNVERCSLWMSTLAQIDHDPHRLERERLRSSFMGFRERVGALAEEISKDLPDLTVHDISHLDALWEVASQITGPDFSLTPAEGYVLGGSILLHDLAMSIAATPGGLRAITSDVRWQDSIVAYVRGSKSREPTIQDLEAPEDDVKQFALFSVLRQLHAENAEQLAFSKFGTGESVQYLIEDTELRQTFGRVIGQIAHSHWWSIGEIERRFDRQIGAPHWAPTTWTIDPLKIACILRAADAAHIDARRAPSFRKIFLNIAPASRVHWDFQTRLNKSYVSEDALVFTSGQAFSLGEATAWWLCLDTLRMVDSELRGIDSLLSDRSMVRFLARRVAGVDSPERLAQYIQTSGWHPINAAVHLSDLPNIIRSLGGEELYGKNPTVPLRELIQNSSDAIRARRCYEKRPHSFGEIAVELREESGTFILRVEDNGIGMSKRVLTQYLLDFGCSFWAKPQVQEEFPGLLSSGFRSTGKYGIGFFSVFMAADKVKIVTRRPDAAATDTLVLEFGSGLDGRPILRPAKRDEQLLNGGTIVELALRTRPDKEDGLLWNRWFDDDGDRERVTTLLSLCQKLAPTLDVDLRVTENGNSEFAIGGTDWVDLPGEQLLRERSVDSFRQRHSEEVMRDFVGKASKNLRVVKDETGKPVARICVTVADHFSLDDGPSCHGAVTVGGFVSTRLQGIAGFMIGEATKAARDEGNPLLPPAKLAEWATQQAALVPNLYVEPSSQAAAAQVIRVCGGDTGVLPIACHNGKWLSAGEIAALQPPEEVIFLDWFITRYELKHVKDLTYEPWVFLTQAGGIPAIFQFRSNYSYLAGYLTEAGLPKPLLGACAAALARAWGVSEKEVGDANDFERVSNVKIGRASGEDVLVGAYIIRKSGSKKQA